MFRLKEPSAGWVVRYYTLQYFFTLIIYIHIYTHTHSGDRGSTVVKVLGYKSEGRWFDPSWSHPIVLSHYGPGVDSASNRNE